METRTLHITSEHVVDSVDAGPDISSWLDDIKIISNLGVVEFPGAIATKGHIFSGPGSSLRATGHISAGKGIGVGDSISAGTTIDAVGDIIASRSIAARGGVIAGGSISAGAGISAGGCIVAGHSINAGDGIESGAGVTAGLSIAAEYVAAEYVAAGTATHRLLAPGDKEIRAEIRSGTVTHGTVVAPGASAAAEPGGN